MIKVLIADDHPLLREGLKHLLSDTPDIRLAGEVNNGFELITKLREETFDVVLMDLSMPGKSGIDLIKQVKVEHPRLPVLVFSTYKEEMYALRSLKAGASGYLCKDYAAPSLVSAIRKVASGGLYISPAVAELMARDFQEPAQDTNPHTQLSDREYQVFLMIAAGKGMTRIASELNLSVKTVSTHKANIKKKMGLDNTSDFVRYVMSHNLTGDGNTGQPS